MITTDYRKQETNESWRRIICIFIHPVIQKSKPLLRICGPRITQKFGERQYSNGLHSKQKNYQSKCYDDRF